MEPVVAFFDDSGDLQPGGTKIFSLGLVVLRLSELKRCSQAWLSVVSEHLCTQPEWLAIRGLEAKSSALHDLRDRLAKGQPPQSKLQKRLVEEGLDTVSELDSLIDALWDFLADPGIEIKYLASLAVKNEVWEQFRSLEFQLWRLRNGKDTNLTSELARFLGEKTFEWLLQRVEYLGDDPDFAFSEALVVGDETSTAKMMYRSQAEAQAGFRQFTDLPKLLNNVWFGSSLHNPCLQMADWIAFACRRWAQGDNIGAVRLKQIMKYFRGYPFEILGRGIVVNPSRTSALPPLP